MQLFETMKIDNGHIPRLTYHTNRIKCSSERLNFKFDEHAWRNELNDVTTKYHSGQYRLKIVLNAESEFETIVSPLPEKSSFTAKFQVLPKAVNPTFINNKTTERKHLAHNHETDLILLLQRTARSLNLILATLSLKRMENGTHQVIKMIS